MVAGREEDEIDELEDDVGEDDEHLEDHLEDHLDDPASATRTETRRRRLERLLPDVLKRAIEKGIEHGLGTITNANDSINSIRTAVGKTELPKEVAGYVFSQVDDTKNAMVRVVAREVREFLEAADLAKELQKVLTTLSFEIKTEIRFIPNDAGGLTPNVKARVGPKLSKEKPAKTRRGLRRPSAEEAEAAESAPDPIDDDDDEI
jgi:hypothetical protein